MRQVRSIAKLAPWAAGVGFLLPAAACDVPVFRYALEAWPADPYRVTLVHRGALAAEPRAAATALRKAADSGDANLVVRHVDLESPGTASTGDLPEPPRAADLPGLFLQAPERAGSDAVIWKGPLTAPNAQRLLDSPARREIRQRLLGGHSAVWLLLEGGARSADERAEEMLKEELPRLEARAKIPAVDPADPRTRINAKLKVAFSLLRVSREDPDEAVLLAQLRHLYPSLTEADAPAVFPLYGRGRVLRGLAGGELVRAKLEEAADFLTGPCACEAKGLNPGTDLLIAADWESLPGERMVRERELPPLTSLSQMAAQARAGDSTDAPPAAAAPPPPSPPSALRRNLLILAVAGVVALAAGTIRLYTRGRPS